MYAWQNRDYKEAGSLVQERDPREFGWGYFSNDTIPQSGIGLFFWFESPDELLDFIVNVETQVWSYGDEDKGIKLKEGIYEVLKEVDLSKGLTSSLRKWINKILIEGEISWWGKFCELCSGKGEFSRQLIDSFYEYIEFVEDNIPKTVTSDHIPKFIEYCKEWGH